MKIVASKRADLTLPGDTRAFEILNEGRGSLGGISVTNDRALMRGPVNNGTIPAAECAAAIDAGGRVELIEGRCGAGDFGLPGHHAADSRTAQASNRPRGLRGTSAPIDSASTVELNLIEGRQWNYSASSNGPRAGAGFSNRRVEEAEKSLTRPDMDGKPLAKFRRKAAKILGRALEQRRDGTARYIMFRIRRVVERRARLTGSIE